MVRSDCLFSVVALACLTCSSVASAQTHVIHATDFTVGETPLLRAFADGFTATFRNPANATIAPLTVVRAPAFGNSIFGNNIVYLDTAPTGVTAVQIDFNQPLNGFVATAGVVQAGEEVDFDTKAYLGGMMVGENLNVVPFSVSHSNVNVTGDFSFSGVNFDRVLLTATFNPSGTFLPDTFGVTTIGTTQTPEPSALAYLTGSSLATATFLRCRKNARKAA